MREIDFTQVWTDKSFQFTGYELVKNFTLSRGGLGLLAAKGDLASWEFENPQSVTDVKVEVADICMVVITVRNLIDGRKQDLQIEFDGTVTLVGRRDS